MPLAIVWAVNATSAREGFQFRNPGKVVDKVKFTGSERVIAGISERQFKVSWHRRNVPGPVKIRAKNAAEAERKAERKFGFKAKAKWLRSVPENIFFERLYRIVFRF